MRSCRLYFALLMFSFTLHFIFFFFLIIRRPPRSTLFPSRRSSDLPVDWLRDEIVGPVAEGLNRQCRVVMSGDYQRSEEHTSELQSLRHLVCRLLLEKKKNTYEKLNAIPLKKAVQRIMRDNLK